MTEPQLKMLKLSAVCSYEAFNWLQAFVDEQQKGQRYPDSVKNFFYRKTNHRQYLSKFLESVIVKVLKSSGADPVKAADAGKYIDKSRVVTDIVGNQLKIGSGNWTKAANVNPGRADIKCFFGGRMLNLEVKVKDSMSDAQKAEQKRAEANNEVYIIIRTVDHFIEIFKQFKTQ